MKESQYLQPYKNHVIESLKDGVKPLSVGTFLTYRLRGKAKNWSDRYLKSLKRGLEKSGWKRCESRGGSIYGAYRP